MEREPLIQLRVSRRLKVALVVLVALLLLYAVAIGVFGGHGSGGISPA